MYILWGINSITFSINEDKQIYQSLLSNPQFTYCCIAGKKNNMILPYLQNQTNGFEHLIIDEIELLSDSTSKILSSAFKLQSLVLSNYSYYTGIHRWE